ncbi:MULTISPECIES: Rrf2 family transcriptional regulator [unclassified Exiguobacterium]|uniref:cysteine metabolism transcriptional regulator CymR n=1 Tax=unclassified Exiguobacterium TaxID=2644629 RepID=UPI000B5896D3|nr:MULTISPECIES: Rrf2 family transcriptional regulator [unclassified Exiguobacterium]ASI37005.1 transcriptional regulator [Exiguobacterium sp. N4-1P]
MKISTKGRYGLTIMIALAKGGEQKPLSLKKIAQMYNLSEHYLEQLIAPLRNGGLVKSVRGAYGGYKLGRKAEEITAGDIIRLLEGPLVVVEGDNSDEVTKRKLWDKIQSAVDQVLDSTTLKDLAEDDDTGYMFYI